MDDIWERSVPFYRISASNLAQVLNRFRPNLTALSCQEVSIGCRNSNYIVTTEDGCYFLRICPPGEKSYVNEKTVFERLDNSVNIPVLLFASKVDNRGCLIYQYVDSVSLRSVCSSRVRVDNDIIGQVARSAALIHNRKPDDFAGLMKPDVPPFREWYDLFLDNSNAVTRLGYEVVTRVRTLIQDNESKLREIDQCQSFIHGDFRPANMLIDDRHRIFIVDWEFSGAGHALADVGQFFRYRSYFDREHSLVFEAEYNKCANVRLPRNWLELSRLRDLVNPLQMIGADGDRPLKYQDLKDIVLDTLGYFGY